MLALLVLAPLASGQQGKVETIAGSGVAGFSASQIKNPYGVVVGPDGALYFCDLDNQRIRRLDFKTHTMSTVAGTGERGYKGDGGLATEAALNMPHEIRFDKSGNLFIVERDNHTVRKVDRRTKIISTIAGTGVAGFSGDNGPARQAQLRTPHSIAFDAGGNLFICDIGNHRIRRVDARTEVISTYAGTGERKPTPDGAPLAGTPLNGPRTIDIDASGNMYLALREGNAIYRIDPQKKVIEHIAGTGEQGYSGDNGPAREAKFSGPKGIAYAANNLYVVDTENHAIRRIELQSGIITTVLGNGERGDGPESIPQDCKLNRPHGIFVDRRGTLYIGDSENHRIRILRKS